MDLILERGGFEPMWRQIYRQIRDRIEADLLPPGTRLQPERLLAARLGVNRATVVEAYRELAADGLVAARVGSGTRVLPRSVPVQETPRTAEQPARRPPFDWTPQLGTHFWPDEPPLRREVRAVRAAPDRISLASGELHPDLMPEARLSALLQEAAASGLSWGYGEVAGYAPLRAALAKRLGRSSADEVVITAGAQHGLALVCRVLAEVGESVAVETPSYFRSLPLFSGLGLRMLPAPVDAGGIRVDALAELMARHKARLMVVNPSFQNPTGATIPTAGRRQLVALARQAQVPLVDDDIYGELWFTEEPQRLRSFDPNGPIIEISSFSKTVAAGVRLGWVAGPPPVVERVTALKAQQEMASPIATQWVMARMLERGEYDEHLLGLRAALRDRRDALAGALLQYLPQCRWQLPDGGFHLWLETPAGISGLAWFRAAARAGVAITPGDLYGATNAVRLNFSYPTPSELEEGVRCLARALRQIHPDDLGSQSGDALV